MAKAPFSSKGERTTELLELIHTVVREHFPIEARGRYSYFITFTDDLSRYGYVYLIRYKLESFKKFKEFKNEVENQLGKKIKKLRLDRGGKYLIAKSSSILSMRLSHNSDLQVHHSRWCK